MSFADLREILFYKLVQSGITHVRKIDVTDLAPAGDIDFFAVGFDHAQLVQSILVAYGLHGNRACSLLCGLRVHFEGDHLISKVDQGFVGSLRRPQGAPIDR
jgi:hypothetical protein